MNKNTKIALIVAGVIALGVGAYLLYSGSAKYKSKDEEKNNRIMSIT